MSESDTSPFTENKTNRMVWIVPSVLLHAILLVVWLMMPEKPPRAPSERKLTINQDQAERLQQHVEDANLVMLHSKISELQAIKKEMAGIRENKMKQLRGFETERVREAPQEGTDLFTRFLTSQNTLINTYGELLEAVRQAEAVTPEKEKVMTGEGLKSVIPDLPEIQELRGKALGVLSILNQESSKTFALLHNGETRLEWIQDAGTAAGLENLKAAMEEARVITERISKSVEAAYGDGWAMSELIQQSGSYADNLIEIEKLEGNLKNWQVSKEKAILRKLNVVFKPSPEVGLIPEAIQAHTEVIREVGQLLEAIRRASEAQSAGGAG